jgi:hypothetical protein
MKKIALIFTACMIGLLSGLPLSSCKTGTSGEREYAGENDMFSVGELQADFKQFRQFLESSHPKLYRFTSRKTFDSLFEAQYRMINRPLSTQEFYPILAPLVARVGCGHTSLWSPDGYWDRAPQRMFPLGVHAREGKLYVIHSYNRESPVAYGSQVLSVNGRDAGILLTELLENIWSDGFIKTGKYWRLNHVFPHLYALNFGYPDAFEITVLEQGMEKRFRMDPIPRNRIRNYRDSLVNSGVIPRKDLFMDLIDEETALLTIRTFAWYDNNKGFKSFIDSSFHVINGLNIAHLIVDLRGNDGGDPFCSTHLISYLQQKPVIYFREPYGRYARFNKPLPMAENPFTGNQYYLIDGRCFSTTGHVTSLLKYHGLGTFVGEETGATYTCNDASHDTRLEYTGYRIQSARHTFAAAVTGFPPDRGIQPDFPVRPSVEDLIRNHDAVLEYTLQMIHVKKAL